MKYANATQQKYADFFVANIAEVTSIAKQLKFRVQDLIEASIYTKLFDDKGEVGSKFINSLDANFATTKTLNMKAIRDYIQFVCSEGAIQVDEHNVPILDDRQAVLLPHEVAKNPALPKSRLNTKVIYRMVQDKVETGEVKKDEEGNEVPKTKKVTRVLNKTEVVRRLATYKWWDFQPTAPAKAYKAKLLTAIKSDLTKNVKGEYIPENDDELRFLEEVAKLAVKYGYGEKIEVK